MDGMICTGGAYNPAVKGCDNMEQWEDAIEQYKRELMRYAKENGRLYAEVSEPPTEQADETPEPAQETAGEAPEPAEATPVWQQYKKGRPMPVEYEGETAPQEKQADEADLPDKPESDELTEGVEREYKSFEEFTKENPARGMLRIQAFAAQQAFPVVNAKIEVEKDFGDGTHTFAEAYTDINGVVETSRCPPRIRACRSRPAA